MQPKEPCLVKEHYLFLNDFDNSVILADALMNKQTNLCGTLQINRGGNPVQAIQQKLKKGEHINQKRGDFTVMRWRDKRNVLKISTNNSPEMNNITNKKRNIVSKPSMVVAFKSISSIDSSDQMVSYYSSPRKSLRWYIKVLFHLMDASLQKGMCIFSKLCPNTKMTYFQF